MRRLLLTALAVILLATAVVASAASLGAGSSSLGAGSAVVGRCATAAPDVVVEVTDGAVTAVVEGLGAACAGSRLELVLLGEDGALLGAGALASVPGGGSFTVPIEDPGDLDALASTRIALVGRP